MQTIEQLARDPEVMRAVARIPVIKNKVAEPQKGFPVTEAEIMAGYNTDPENTLRGALRRIALLEIEVRRLKGKP